MFIRSILFSPPFIFGQILCNRAAGPVPTGSRCRKLVLIGLLTGCSQGGVCPSSCHGLFTCCLTSHVSPAVHSLKLGTSTGTWLLRKSFVHIKVVYCLALGF